MAGGVFVAFITGIMGIIAGSKRAKADVANVITAGFQALVDQLQEERTNDREEIRRLREEIASLRSHVFALENVIRANGLSVPSRGA